MQQSQFHGGTMNLRSVFTAEQQRILEHYYENGMTNQSKSCFQLILQCAQEAKLDFSVVRTWVGNKRRKLASKADHNSTMASGTTNFSLAGIGGTNMAAGVAALKNDIGPIGQRGPQRYPVPVSSSSSSSSPSSCSPHSSGSGNGSNANINNDVIVTGVYSVARMPGNSDTLSQTKALPKPPYNPVQIRLRSAPQTELITLPRKSGPALHIRQPFSEGDLQGVPRTWARQYVPPQSHSWPTTHAPAPIATNSKPSTSESGVRVQQVFSLAGLSNVQTRLLAEAVTQAKVPPKTRPPESSGCFSIAMETADADDEYTREEELANMGAQIQIGSTLGAGGCAGSVASEVPRKNSLGLTVGKILVTVKPPASDQFWVKENPAPSTSSQGPPRQGPLLCNAASQSVSRMRFPQDSSSQRNQNIQVSSNLSPVWIINNSRKRTLQNRTEFSDKDLHILKRYWDNGMTSLGSVCREKISAASSELNVDSEIVKTWIGNRRRKYRLMGIEIPTPKGGPPVFTSQSSGESPRCLTPEIDQVQTPEPEEESERIEEVSVNLSEDESDSVLRDEDDVTDDGDRTALVNSVKVEVMDNEEEDEDDVIGSERQHMQNLLEFKQEEVRYLESELENQKQKYYRLQDFTRNLLSAVKNTDTQKQQELLASLPQEAYEDWDVSLEREEPDVSIISSQGNNSLLEDAEEAALS